MRNGTILGALSLLAWLGCKDTDPGNTLPDAGSPDAAAPDAGQDSGVVPDSGVVSDAGVVPDAGSTPRPCLEGGTLRHYSLSPLSSLPSRDMLQLPNLIQGAEIVSAGTGTEFSARFDVCDDGSALSLIGLLVSNSSFETPTFYRWDDTVTAPVDRVVELDEGFVVQRSLPPSAFSVEGLEAALQGDLAPLRIRLIAEYGLLVMGHEGFLAVASGRVGPNSIDYHSIYVVVGGLVEGNVFANLTCRFGEQPFAKSFTMATATFEVEACTFLGGGETIGYRITSLAVQDSSPELSEPERQRFEFPTTADVERVMNYAWNHHNGCDSFHLALDHADYAATTSPLAGCGTAVPNAPPRSFDEDPGSPVQYRIRYHGGAWVDGTMTGCSHYLFCN